MLLHVFSQKILVKGLKIVKMECFTCFWIRIVRNYCIFTPRTVPNLENIRKAVPEIAHWKLVAEIAICVLNDFDKFSHSRDLENLDRDPTFSPEGRPNFKPLKISLLILQ